MNTRMQDHYHGLTNRLYMMLQSIECCDLYLSAHHLPDSDSLDMNVAYLWFCQTKRSEEFQKKIAQRYPIIIDYCAQTDMTVGSIDDYGTLYELYYVLNSPDITEETLPDYMHSLDDLVHYPEANVCQSNNNSQMPCVAKQYPLVDEEYIKEHRTLLRPLYHSLKQHQLQPTPEKLTDVEYRFEKHYKALRTSVSRFLPAA